MTSAVLPSTDWRRISANDRATGALLLFDYDLDGDLDLLEVHDFRQRLLRNDKGKFTDITAQAGALSKAAKTQGTAAIAGDYDNDMRPDVFILRPGTATLYHNDGNGSFSDVTRNGKDSRVRQLVQQPQRFVDFDHDGDLDLLAWRRRLICC